MTSEVRVDDGSASESSAEAVVTSEKIPCAEEEKRKTEQGDESQNKKDQEQEEEEEDEEEDDDESLDEWDLPGEDDVGDSETESEDLDENEFAGFAAGEECDPEAKEVVERNLAPVEVLVPVLNMVFTTRLKHANDERRPVRLNIRFLLKHLKRYGFVESRERFPSIIVRCQFSSDMRTARKCSVRLFQEGRVVCPGTRNPRDAKHAIEKILQLVRSTRRDYSDLCIGPLRVQNIVGTASYAHAIDVQTMHAREPSVSFNVKSQGAIIKTHSASGSLKLRDGERRTKIAIFVYRSGYVVITGAKRPSILASVLAHTMKTVRHYFLGNVENSFAQDQVRRYCTSLESAVRAYEDTHDQVLVPSNTINRHRTEFIVVRQDGTVGTMEEWFTQCKPHARLHQLRAKLGEVYTGGEEEQRMAQVEYGQPAQKKQRSMALIGVAASSTPVHAEQSLQLARMRDQKQLALRSDRGSLRTSVVREIQGMRSAKEEIQREEKALLVAEIGARAAYEQAKPKQTKIMPMHVASELDRGF